MKRKKSTKLTFKFGSDRRSQADAMAMIYGMMGRDIPASCEKCGGLAWDEASASSRCICAKTPALETEGK